MKQTGLQYGSPEHSPYVPPRESLVDSVSPTLKHQTETPRSILSEDAGGRPRSRPRAPGHEPVRDESVAFPTSRIDVGFEDALKTRSDSTPARRRRRTPHMKVSTLGFHNTLPSPTRTRHAGTQALSLSLSLFLSAHTRSRETRVVECPFADLRGRTPSRLARTRERYKPEGYKPERYKSRHGRNGRRRARRATRRLSARGRLVSFFSFLVSFFFVRVRDAAAVRGSERVEKAQLEACPRPFSASMCVVLRTGRFHTNSLRRRVLCSEAVRDL